jgi:hypothetical protein
VFFVCVCVSTCSIYKHCFYISFLQSQAVAPVLTSCYISHSSNEEIIKFPEEASPVDESPTTSHSSALTLEEEKETNRGRKRTKSQLDRSSTDNSRAENDDDESSETSSENQVEKQARTTRSPECTDTSATSNRRTGPPYLEIPRKIWTAAEDLAYEFL